MVRSTRQLRTCSSQVLQIQENMKAWYLKSFIESKFALAPRCGVIGMADNLVTAEFIGETTPVETVSNGRQIVTSEGLSNGVFVTVWREGGSFGTDSDTFAQGYDASGAEVGSQI